MTSTYSYHFSKRQRLYLPLKRLIDLFGSIIGIIICFLFLWWWVAIIQKISSKGTVLFIQSRKGKDDKPFKLLKFRSMKMDSNHYLTSSSFDEVNSITKFGKFLRKSSIDETPQLLNIFLGHMSFIGPRPLIDINEDAITLKIRRENSSTRIRPGISGWAQINGRTKVSPEKKAEMDGYYLRHMSLFLDIVIFFKSMF